MKFDMYFKNIKNMQFNGQILKIHSHVNLFSKSCSLKSQLSLQLNFVLKALVPQQYIRKNFERYVTCNIDNVTIMQQFQNMIGKTLYFCVIFFLSKFILKYFNQILYNLSFMTNIIKIKIKIKKSEATAMASSDLTCSLYSRAFL